MESGRADTIRVDHMALVELDYVALLLGKVEMLRSMAKETHREHADILAGDFEKLLKYSCVDVNKS